MGQKRYLILGPGESKAMLHTVTQLMALARDLVQTVEPEAILNGSRMFRPFMKYQNSWMRYFYPDDVLFDKGSSWFYLQKYMMPLVKQHASSYHLDGIKMLNLDQDQAPDFKEFQQLFLSESRGFKIHPVTKEIDAREYFTLISQKRFPCVERIRSIEELFCANEPDFWHEAIGHLAPLCSLEVQDFYLQTADAILSAHTEVQFQEQIALAWTLMEYGFIKEQGQTKMFGAALVGSHLANMRYLKGLMSITTANRDSIIDSDFYSETSRVARDDLGNFLYYCLDDLRVDELFGKN